MGELKRQEEVEIDLKDIMLLILQNAAVIILVAVCVGIFMYTNSKSKVSKVYTSYTKMYILSRNNAGSSANSDSKFVESVLKDFKALVTSKEILEEVNRKLAVDKVEPVAASQIAVLVTEDNKIVNLSVTDANPIASMKMANTIRTVMSQYMKSAMNINLFDVVEEAMIGTPSVVDKAKRNAVLGGFAVACLIMGVIVMRYLIDDSLKTPEEIEAKLGLCVLATIPETNKKVSTKNKWKFKHRNGNKPPKGGTKDEEEKKSENTDFEIVHLKCEGVIL